MFSARVELYFTSHLEEEDEVTFPRFDLSSVLLSTSVKTFTNQSKLQILKAMKPLRVFVGQLHQQVNSTEGGEERQGLDFDQIVPSAKTLLVYCAEMAVMLSETSFIPGSICKKLLSINSERLHGMVAMKMYELPVSLVYRPRLEDNQVVWVGKKNGLHPKLLPLPTSTLFNGERMRSRPSYIQPTADTSIHSLLYPRSYHDFFSTFKFLMCYYTERSRAYHDVASTETYHVNQTEVDTLVPLTVEGHDYGLFDQGDCTSIARMPAWMVEEFLQRLCRLCIDYYDWNIFEIMKQRMLCQYHANELVDFQVEKWDYDVYPKSTDELREWRTSQNNQVCFGESDDDLSRQASVHTYGKHPPFVFIYGIKFLFLIIPDTCML